MREKFDDTKIQAELKNVNGWKYNNGAIEKNLVFKNFKEALSTMVRIGFEAEKMNHHPDWSNVYNKLNVRLNTHDANGITEKDFALAKKIDEIIA
ncbi:MAG: 4a-hydroxytetrahydrobiopterin dehydratase [Bacteroidia bacterium]|nr:4a-hydroxytetrahydrobiopterin dehydratase [Bacteroidia bacterium]